MTSVAALRKRIETFPRSACPCCRSRLQLAKSLLQVAAKLGGDRRTDAPKVAGSELLELAGRLLDVEDGA